MHAIPFSCRHCPISPMQAALQVQTKYSLNWKYRLLCMHWSLLLLNLNHTHMHTSWVLSGSDLNLILLWMTLNLLAMKQECWGEHATDFSLSCWVICIQRYSAPMHYQKYPGCTLCRYTGHWNGHPDRASNVVNPSSGMQIYLSSHWIVLHGTLPPKAIDGLISNPYNLVHCNSTVWHRQIE